MLGTGERRVRRGLFEEDTTPPLTQIRDEMVMANPGRVGAVLEKPGPHDTPYRSTLFVTGRQSADGNDYRVGDPIPEVEADRQGLVAHAAAAMPYSEPDHKLCTRCMGTGNYSKRKPKNHPENHDCLFCGPCPVCEGTGKIFHAKEETDGG